MDIKLIALDLDGTLLNDNLEITPATLKAIQQTRDLGITVIISTGRPFIAALHYIEQLQLESPVICHNGAVIIKPNGEVLCDYALDKGPAVDFINFCKAQDYVLSLFIQKEIFMERDHPLTWDIHVRLNRTIPKIVADFAPLLTTPPIKILVSGEKEKIPTISSVLKSNFENRLNISQSGEFYLDIVNKGISKGSSVQIVSQMLGIPMTQVMTMGDNYNDLEMIEEAGLGVVMGNAAEDLKARGKFVTYTNNEDGVGHALRKFVLA